ncbi:MAG: translocation/assembly module TamB domain-containing protein [Cyclobacteriaceae bacterium]
MPPRSKNFFSRLLKLVAWVVGSVILLLVLVALLIRIPAVQLKLTQKAVAFLEEKIGTKVSLEGIRISFPKNIVLEGLYLEDQQGDTLLYAGKFSVNTDLWALTRNEVQLNDIVLENSVAFVDRAENHSAFNFTYILEAFAGDSTAVPDRLEQKGWDFSLKNITLETVRLHYDDLLQGNNANISVGKFELEMREFDLVNSIVRVEEILLSETQASLVQSKVLPAEPPNEAAADSSAAVFFSLEELSLENVRLRYEQSLLGQVMLLDLTEARVFADKIDIENREIDLKSVTLEESSLHYQQHQTDTLLPVNEKEKNQKGEEKTQPWNIAVNELNFSRNSIQYYDFTQPHSKRSVDFDHLWLTAFTIDARYLRYGTDGIQGDLRNIAFQEHSGFVLKAMQGKVNITETEATLNDFLILTGNSRLQMEARAGFSSLENISEAYPHARISADINESFLNARDILYFQPDLLDSLPVHLTADMDLNVDAAFRGAVNDLQIRHLDLRVLSETILGISGRISGLPSVDNLGMNVVIEKFHTIRADIESILADTLLPESLQLPRWVNVEGGFHGTMEKAVFNTLLTSDVGTVDVQGKINVDPASALRGFYATVRLDDAAVGKVLGKPDSVMGNLTMQAKLHTTGLTPEEMNGTFTASVDHFSFNGYHYNDLMLYGTIRDQELSANASIKDDHLEFTLDAGYNFKEPVPRYLVTLDLKNADFEALNLVQNPIRARGTLVVDLATADFKVLNGNVGIRKVAIFNGDELYAIDSLLFASIDQEGLAEIKVDSDLLEAKFEGSINIFGLPGVVREYFNTYYSLHDSPETKDAEHQHFSFNIQLKNTTLLTGLLVPKLTKFVPGEIKGEFDSKAQKLDLRMQIDEMQYANIGIDSFVFTTKSNETVLRYNLVADKIMVDSMKIDGLEFSGAVANDSMLTNLVILDSANNKKYVLAGKFFSQEKGFELRLSPEGTILNYQNWKVPVNNFMRFGGKKFIAQNVALVNGREKIIIESKPDPGAPISIGFRELNLEYLTSMIAEEKPLSGLVQGDINLFPDSSPMTFTADLTVDDFKLRQISWGDLSLQVAQKVRNRFDVDIALKGNQNDVTILGFYTGGESAAMDLTLKLNRFNLPSIQPLVASQVQNLSGALSGQIQVKGTPERPHVDGSVRVQQAQFRSTFLNSTYFIDQETISFNGEGIGFDGFEIADNDQNKARVHGNILTSTYRDFKFNVDLTTDDFRLLNTTSEDNELFYGKANIEAIARIRGTMTTPIINLQIGLAEGSDLTYVVPQSEASILQSEGIVKFVDKTFEGDPFMAEISMEASDTVKSTFRGIDLTARIELSDRENFTIIIDPITQDQLTVSGNSTLTLKIDPTGDIQLAGRYEITEGTYKLSFYKFVKREFSIESGSTITWSGDPLNADMNIRAMYEVETSPVELFSSQLTGADPSMVNQYKQRLPFLVYLNITGQLLQPEIAFELAMPMDERNVFGGSVYARLQDINTRESDLNKQVFALLILKRFIADNPFENQAAGGFESTARRSVSKILSEQLNRLSENIKGVELSFDIKSYEEYSSGQADGQTELQLGVSKSLFNDRLVVKLSGNIDIEGQNSNREATDYIGDLALEYKITPDGRFRITGFRNSNYDMIDGELIETGAGLIYVKDYNTLTELFKANAETKN